MNGEKRWKVTIQYNTTTTSLIIKFIKTDKEMSHKKTSKTSQTTWVCDNNRLYYIHRINYIVTTCLTSDHHLKHVLKNHNIYIVYVHVNKHTIHIHVHVHLCVSYGCLTNGSVCVHEWFWSTKLCITAKNIMIFEIIIEILMYM